MDEKGRRIVLIIVVLIIIGSIYFFESSKVNIGDYSIPSDIVSVNDSISREVFPLKVLNEADRYTISGPSIKNKISKYPMASELVGIEGYINIDNIKIENLRGKVILIDFWTYSCINCIRTLPYITSWDAKYRDMGLVIIGVHTPEFGFEKDYDNVVDATVKHGIEYAVVQDNNYMTWRAYNNRFWPRKYLIDGDGFIRFDHIGEGAYEKTELKIQELLAELGVGTSDVVLTEEGVGSWSLFIRTPELYAGYKFTLSRGQNVGNKGGLQYGKVVDYVLPKSLNNDVIYIEGTWKSNEDDLELVGDFGKVILNFKGSEVNIVADSIEVQEISVFVDDEEMESVRVDNPDLYNVYDGNYKMEKLELRVSNGFSFNAFTFG